MLKRLQWRAALQSAERQRSQTGHDGEDGGPPPCKRRRLPSYSRNITGEDLLAQVGLSSEWPNPTNSVLSWAGSWGAE
eukprot:15451857-Alexandrium_andersonii.AAC.1